MFRLHGFSVSGAGRNELRRHHSPLRTALVTLGLTTAGGFVRQDGGSGQGIFAWMAF